MARSFERFYKIFTENEQWVNKRLTILQINDTRVPEHQEMFRDAGGKRHAKIDGYAKISSNFKQVRNERGTIVAVRQFFF